MYRTGVILGILAVLALLGTLSGLPPFLAFPVCALAMVLFPGLVITELASPDLTPAERLALWFVAGVGAITLVGFAAHVFKLRLSDVVVILVTVYSLAIAAMLMRRGLRRRGPAGSPMMRARFGLYGGLAALAGGAAIITLLTRRDYDDWYYLAYIRDYFVNKPIGAENGIFGPSEPVAARVWFGGGWWVLEALLSKASAVDPIALHQVYLPLLLIPFAVLACFMLARRLFGSDHAALAASACQVLFLLSSAFPFKSTGWAFFCRIAQDKLASCFIMVPVAVALALKLVSDAGQESTPAGGAPGDQVASSIGGRSGGKLHGRATYFLYCWAILTTLLVHGLGPVWCGVFILPLVLIEWLRARDRIGAQTPVRLLLPILISGLLLMLGRDAVMTVIVAPTPEAVPLLKNMSGVYLPGNEFTDRTETVFPIVWVWRDWVRILHPLFITRYPIAMLGFVMSFALLAWRRRSSAARFLFGSVCFTIFLVYTPPGAALAAAFMTWRLVFRLVWILPWGLVLGFMITRERVRPFVAWLIILGSALALARGDPRNYVTSLSTQRNRNRPAPELTEAFRYLEARPSPQGVVLAPETLGRMVAGYLPDAYPLNFREYGPVKRDMLERLMDSERIDTMLRGVIDRYGVRYILLDHRQPLAGALNTAGAGFELLYENESYALWSVR